MDDARQYQSPQLKERMKSAGNQEPECEHPRAGDMSALRIFFAKQSRALALLQQADGHLVTAVSPISGRKENLPFDEGNKDNEYDEASIGSSVQAAIQEIQKEASRIDLVMALDQLQTLESENNAVRISLHERSMEADILRGELKEMHERVSGLTLERDLLKADTKKLREDLKTCVERMFDISMVAGASSFAESSASSSSRDEKKVTEKRQRPSTQVLSRDLNLCTMFQSKALLEPDIQGSSSRIAMKEVDEDHEARKAPAYQNEVSSRRERCEIAEREFLHQPTVFRTLNQGASDPTSSLGITERNRSIRLAFSSDSILLSGEVKNPENGKEKIRDNVSNETTPIRQTRKIKTKKEKWRGLRHSCRLFFCSSRSKQFVAMGEQLEELHAVVKTSLSTSEILRQRLSMIGHYYEDIIFRLQDEVADMKAEKIRSENNFSTRMSSIDKEKESVVYNLESKLRKREDEIAKLKTRC